MRQRSAGFSLIEVLMAVTVGGVLAAATMAPISGAMGRYSINTASRTIASEVRAARSKAVATNRTMRVRFNCPGPAQFRTVELVGDPAIDGDADRCSDTAYPYPDRSPATAPNADGPVISLKRVTFGVVDYLQISPRGRIEALGGCPDNCQVVPGNPASIEVTNGHDTETLTVSLSGAVRRTSAYTVTKRKSRKGK